MENKTVLTEESLTEIDALLSEKTITLDGASKKAESEAALQFKGRMRSLPGLLRTIGAIVLMASAATFLMQQWQGLDHVGRYFSFLAFTVVLALSGFFCGLRMREDKGARTLLALAAAIIPVHFCQLGALLYSCFGLDGNLQRSIPSYLLWVAPNAFSASLTVVVGVVALIPIAFLAFSALCRPEASSLTIAYAAANSLLLIPTRNPDAIGVLVLGLLAGTAALDSYCFKISTSMKTREGLFCRSMLAMPVLLMIGRTLQLYPTSELFYSLLWAAVALVMFCLMPSYCEDKARVVRLQTYSFIPAALSWYTLCQDIFTKFPVSSNLQIPMVVLPFCLILGVMSLYASGNKSFYRESAALLGVGGMALQLVVFGGTLSSLLIVVVSIATLAYGYVSSEKIVFYSGAAGFGFGLLYHLRYAMDLYTLCPWLSLGVAGLLTVLAGSYIEKNWVQIAQKVGELQKNMEAKKNL